MNVFATIKSCENGYFTLSRDLSRCEDTTAKKMKIVSMICTLVVLCYVAQGQETSTNEGGEQTCLAGWSLKGDQCYWVSKETLSFEEAKSSCEDKKATLFEPMSEEENKQVHDLVASSKHNYLIGIKRSIIKNEETQENEQR